MIISPLILLFGTCSFAVALILHILVWRIIRPLKHLVWLGVIFIILPLFIYILLSYLSHTLTGLSKYFTSPFSIAFSLLWHLSLSSAYIMSYPLFQADCPSLKIIMAVSASMPEGMTLESINNFFSEDILLYDRLDDLVDDGLILVKNDKCEISLKGRLLSIFFSIYRRSLGLPLGEG